WAAPSGDRARAVINPATEKAVGAVAWAEPPDVERAVGAAVRAFPDFAASDPASRLALLERIAAVYAAHAEALATIISEEMGAPITLARKAQVPAGLAHLREAAEALRGFAWERPRGATLMRWEPVGVCALITPWNWPMNQICCKVAPAVAAGCTMVLKPSEQAPLSAHRFAAILAEAGVPPGVFNLIDGDGAGAGSALAAHPGVDMVSFTGSVRGGIAVAQAAAPTVKRVTQELGGKSAFLVTADASLREAAGACARACFRNSGQSCNAPTRLLVPAGGLRAAAEAAAEAADATVVGDPRSPLTEMGPLAGAAQFAKVQRLIQTGLDEGAELAAGGLGRPPGCERGYFARPTVFTRVRNEMTIAQEEIFGPVLAILGYETEEEAVRIANDTPFGLSNYVVARDRERASAIARRLRSGNVHVNGAGLDFGACFGGYKRSGNGREWGRAGLREFLELKAIFGYAPATPPCPR
ncbi:MAG: aldehyde dehydrogenase family protein, partial [Terriglobales bacterium]